MNMVIHGVIHGKTIELAESPGVADGREVEVVVRVIETARPSGEGIRRSAGALTDDPHWDAIMAEVQRERKLERRPQENDL